MSASDIDHKSLYRLYLTGDQLETLREVVRRVLMRRRLRRWMRR